MIIQIFDIKLKDEQSQRGNTSLSAYLPSVTMSWSLSKIPIYDIGYYSLNAFNDRNITSALQTLAPLSIQRMPRSFGFLLQFTTMLPTLPCCQHIQNIYYLLTNSTQLSTETKGFTDLAAVGACPCPKLRDWNLSNIFTSVASWISADVGSTPGDSTNRREVFQVDSSHAACVLELYRSLERFDDS